MKKIICAVLALSATATFAADVYVQGYTRADGTYVAPHMQTAPDNTVLNNYSTRGNVNPYTGQAGTVNPYGIQQPRAPEARPLTIQPIKPLKY